MTLKMESKMEQEKRPKFKLDDYIEPKTESIIKYTLSGVALLCGIVLVFINMFMPPQKEIADTALYALLQLLAFSGAVIGISMNFDYKMRKMNSLYEKKLQGMESKIETKIMDTITGENNKS